MVFAIALLQTAPVYPATSGPLKVSAVNSRYFADANGKIVYLTGSHNWDNFQDEAPLGQPLLQFDFNSYLSMLKSHNHNYMRLWVWEGWAGNSYDASPENASWFDPLPYLRTGPGNALDGKKKFDLTQYDKTYFDRLRSRVIAARDAGIYVGVMLFQGWSGAFKFSRAAWPGHPYHAANNVNGINGDPSSVGYGTAVHSLQDPKIVAMEENYVKKVLDTLGDLDNVLYEISNEDEASAVSWQSHMIDLIHSYETGKMQHPVGMSGDISIADSSLYSSNANWIGPSDPSYASNPPPATGPKPIIIDSDHLADTTRNQVWVWRSFMRGLNPIEMDDITQNDPGRVGMRNSMGYTLSYANRMNLANVTPQGNLATTGYCLAAIGSQYLVYAPAGGTFTVTLSGKSFTAEWFDPTNNKTIPAGTTNGKKVRFTPPFSGDAVLYLYQ